MDTTIKLMSLVGARPQFIKLAPLARAINQMNDAVDTPSIQHIIIHTGQHYDYGMSDIFFDELGIPHPDINLGVGSGRHGEQTGKMLAGIEEALIAHKPDLLVIFGDTNSTVAGALAASKLHIPIAHVEAGLRSFNRTMPEEINRIVADHVSDILLAPTPTAIEHLKREGLAEKTVSSGDIMYDTVLHNVQLAEAQSEILRALPVEKGAYAIATCHRAENTNDPQRLRHIFETFNHIAATGTSIILPLHPRTKNMLPNVLPGWKPDDNLHVIEPVGYLDMMQLVHHARLALTDSGGLQKEAFFLNTPCITMRDETEWIETVQAGANIITSADPDRIMEAYKYWMGQGEVDFGEEVQAYFGHADSANLTLKAILDFLHQKMLNPVL
ncbi:MAG: UDP-N-acetylglucosamine 2-epimerase (non-hydrolyzing) [Bacteroidota bacterium]